MKNKNDKKSTEEAAPENTKKNFQVFLPKKLSAKTILGNVAAFYKKHREPIYDPGNPEKQIGERFKDGSDKILAFRIVGFLSDVRTGESNFGSYLEFRGEFLAIDPNGNEHKSTKAFLPTPVDQMLCDAHEAAFDAAEDNDINAGKIQFAFDVYLAPNESEKGGTPYQYVTSPLIPSEKSDPCEQLMKQCGQLLLEGGK